MAICPTCKNLIEEPLPTETLEAQPARTRVCLVVCPNCNTVLGAIPDEVAIPGDLRAEE
jgi:hypothetical protein